MILSGNIKFAIERIVDFSYKENVNSVLYGYSSYIEEIKGPAFSHKLKTKNFGKEIVETLMPHFIGHSFSDINKWISGKAGLREGKEHIALWRIMIDAEVLFKSGLKFDENLSLGEDTKFLNSYYLYEDSIGFLDECLYYLRKRMNGLNMTSLSNPVLMASNKLKLIKARMEIDDVANQKGIQFIIFGKEQLFLAQ